MPGFRLLQTNLDVVDRGYKKPPFSFLNNTGRLISQGSDETPLGDMQHKVIVVQHYTSAGNLSVPLTGTTLRRAPLRIPIYRNRLHQRPSDLIIVVVAKGDTIRCKRLADHGEFHRPRNRHGGACLGSHVWYYRRWLG